MFFGAEPGVAFGEFAGVRGNVEARRGEWVDTA
jgi:hypothetical protein